MRFSSRKQNTDRIMKWALIVLVCVISCQERITAQNDFQLVFRAVAGVTAPDPYELWISNSALNEDEPAATELTGAFKGHYKSTAALYWSTLDIDEVKISLYKDGQVQKELIFDGSGTSTLNWFDSARIVDSPWTDLTSTTTGLQDFTAAGTANAAVVRRFLITKSYGGCGTDEGWMMMITRTGVCAFDKPAGIQHPFFIYSNQATAAVWQGDTSLYDFADVFAIFIKLNSDAAVDVPLSIRCMDLNCAVPESGGVIYIQVSISTGFLQLAATRRRRSRTDHVEMDTNVISGLSVHKRARRQTSFIDSAVVKTTKGITGTADAVKDYGSVFMEAEETLTIPIEIVDDLLVEGDETFTVELVPLISDGSEPRDMFTVTVTIIDDDVAPQPEVLIPVFSLDKYMYPVRESVTAVTVVVKRTVDTSKQQSISLRTSGVDAVSPNDYSSVPISLQFQPGENEKMADVIIVDDNVLEATECLEITLEDPEDGHLGTPSTATIFIKDDDVTHRFSSHIYTADENDGTVEIAILRRGFLAKVSSVDVESTDGTATSPQPGNDYNALDTTVDFSTDDSVQYVNIDIVRDGKFENDEYLTLELKGNNPGEISEPMVARVIIKSNDALCDPPCMNEGVCSNENTCDCTTGFTGNVCQTALKLVAGRFTLVEANGFEAVYDSALANPYSQEYQNLERQVITELSPVFSERLTGYHSMAIEGFFEGSIIVEYVVMLDISSVVVAETVKMAVGSVTNNAGFISGSSLKLTPTLVSTDECPASYCLNIGFCSTADGNYYCLCSDDFEGDRCESERTDTARTAGPLNADQSSSRLSDGIIGVIAMTLFMIVLVSLAFITCGCWYFGKLRRKPKTVEPQVVNAPTTGFYGNVPLIVDGGQIYGF